MDARLKPMLIAIGGPTASGKTDLTVKLAEAYNTSVLSADSRQIYKEMNIGTAKPDKSILERTPHLFIDHCTIADDYSAGQYEKEALIILEDLFKGKKMAFVSGGTGFYLKALLDGIPDIPPIDDKIKAEVSEIFVAKGLSHIINVVEGLDPLFAEKADRSNSVRWIRALQVIKATGKPFSSFKNPKPKSRNFRTLRLCIDIPRDELHKRINERVDLMFINGLVEEVRQLLPFRDKPALQTVGYQEVFAYLDGDLTLDECMEKVKVNTRRYAKRQVTWFKNQGDWKWLEPDVELFRKEVEGKLYSER